MNMVDPTGHFSKYINYLRAANSSYSLADQFNKKALEAEKELNRIIEAGAWNFGGDEAKSNKIKQARSTHNYYRENADQFKKQGDYFTKLAALSTIPFVDEGKLLRDLENYDITNTNGEVVIASNYISAYKGKLVIRHSLSDVFGDSITSCAIMGTIFLNRNVTEEINKTENVLNHERGHLAQEEILGPRAYWEYIALPSLKHRNPQIYYYNQPWERGADDFGGVSRSRHTPEYGDSAMYYLAGAAYEAKLKGWR